MHNLMLFNDICYLRTFKSSLFGSHAREAQLGRSRSIRAELAEMNVLTIILINK